MKTNITINGTSLKIFFWHIVAAVFFMSCNAIEPDLWNDDPGLAIDTARAKVGEKVTGTRTDILTPSKVMMQAFYWDTEPRSEWWNTVSGKIDGWAAAGIDAIWIPPPAKGASGGFSMGYDPYDYFDFGDFDQKGSIKTRFGNKEELKAMIKKAHDKKMAVVVDMVINHTSGGDLEPNPFTGNQTYTSFNPMSGKFKRSAADFHPNRTSTSDAGAFGGFPDFDLTSAYVKNWFYKTDASAAYVYMNDLGIDAWRFDFVKGFDPALLKDWTATVGGWAVGEYYDGSVELVKKWADQSGTKAFDFPNFFNMRDAFRNKNLGALSRDALFKRDANQAVTFVGNHDTEDRKDNSDDFPNQYQSHAYAYIMMMPSMPCVFYTHYEKDGSKNDIDLLIKMRNDYIGGESVELWSSPEEYIVYNKGDKQTKQGALLYINLSDDEKEREIDTDWGAGFAKEQTGKYGANITVDAQGKAKIKAPKNGYAVWTFTTAQQVSFPAKLKMGASGPDLNATATPPDGKYKGYVELTAATTFKFTDGTDQYGNSASTIYSGALAKAGGNDIALPAGNYQAEADLTNNTFSFVSWALIGNATPNGWNGPDHDMKYNAATKQWEITLQMTAGEFKFRKNNTWDKPEGDDLGGQLNALTQGGTNISVSKADTYVIKLDVTGKKATMTSAASYPAKLKMGASGPDLNATATPPDGKYKGYVELTAATTFKFTDGTDQYGNSASTTYSGALAKAGGNDIALPAGNYQAEADLANNTFSFVSWALIGNATPNGWGGPDHDMKYNATAKQWEITLQMTAGDFKFRKNNTWNGTPEGDDRGGQLNALTQGGANIQITKAAKYKIILNEALTQATLTEQP